jgi:hypothetical protein
MFVRIDEYLQVSHMNASKPPTTAILQVKGSAERTPFFRSHVEVDKVLSKG